MARKAVFPFREWNGPELPGKVPGRIGASELDHCRKRVYSTTPIIVARALYASLTRVIVANLFPVLRSTGRHDAVAQLQV